MRLLFVGDAERDEAVVPCLMAQILGCDKAAVCAQMEFVPWKALGSHGRAFDPLRGAGYHKKIQLAFREVSKKNLRGLVATVDRDSAKRFERLKQLQKGRDRHREKNERIPTALGEALPHLEAWLLDDPVAVKSVLGIPAEAEIPTHPPDPKAELNRLIDEYAAKSGKTRLELLAEIASQVNATRCAHTKETGFALFSDEVQNEVGSK